MALPFQVFKGPGNRLIALSMEPLSGSWVVKTGEEGKALRTSQVPASKHSDFGSLLHSFVPDKYRKIYEGNIDQHGRPVGSAPDVVYWEVNDIDIATLIADLRDLADQLSQYSVPFAWTDELSGTYFEIDNVFFGVARAPSPGLIDYSGHSAASLSLAFSSDLAALLALTMEKHPIKVVDDQGNSLSRRTLLDRCGNRLTKSMASFIESRGYQSLSLALRDVDSKAVLF